MDDQLDGCSISSDKRKQICIEGLVPSVFYQNDEADGGCDRESSSGDINVPRLDETRIRRLALHHAHGCERLVFDRSVRRVPGFDQTLIWLALFNISSAGWEMLVFINDDVPYTRN